MARTVVRVRPPPDWQPADASSEPPTPLGQGRSFQLERNIELAPLADNGTEMLMMPPNYYERKDVGEDAGWRQNDDGTPHACWQTTLIYQHIHQNPRLVRYDVGRVDALTEPPADARPQIHSARSMDMATGTGKAQRTAAS